MSRADRVVLPLPLETLVKATLGPYAPGGKRDAVSLGVKTTVTPIVSAEPKSGLAVSQDGVLMENLMEPLEAATRYSIGFRVFGWFDETETTNPVAGVTIKAGGA